MLNHLNRYNQASSSCGIPLLAELHACINEPQSPGLEETLIWIALLGDLDEAVPLLAKRQAAHSLAVDEAVALCAAMHLVGNSIAADSHLQQMLARSLPWGSEVGSPIPGLSKHWQVRSLIMELAERSPHAELIRQASLLHLSDPAELLADWLKQLGRAIGQQMPFTALLRLSILWRQSERLPDDWQSQLAKAITEVGDLADAVPLYRLWMVICQLAPDWDFACIRAAELALRFEDFPIADHLLKRLEQSDIKNVWFYDVKARCRYSYGDLKTAAHLWSQALAKLTHLSSERQVFYDRMTVALRGRYGLAEASRLLRAGQLEAAQQLLRFLILHDPSFPHHHRLLAALQTSLAVGDQVEERQSQHPPSVEPLIERFRPLWQEKGTPPNSSDSPEDAWAFAQQTDAFLDTCEQALWPTEI